MCQKTKVSVLRRGSERKFPGAKAGQKVTVRSAAFWVGKSYTVTNATPSNDSSPRDPKQRSRAALQQSHKIDTIRTDTNWPKQKGRYHESMRRRLRSRAPGFQISKVGGAYAQALVFFSYLEIPHPLIVNRKQYRTQNKYIPF